MRAGKCRARTTNGLVSEYAAAATGSGKVLEIARDPKNPSDFIPVYSGIGILKGRKEFVEAVKQGVHALLDEDTNEKVLERSNMSAFGPKSAEANQWANPG